MRGLLVAAGLSVVAAGLALCGWSAYLAVSTDDLAPFLTFATGLFCVASTLLGLADLRRSSSEAPSPSKEKEPSAPS